MTVLTDTNILSTFSKIGRVSLLHQLFSDDQISISPGILMEIKNAREKGYAHAESLIKLVEKCRITILAPTSEELLWMQTLPENFGPGEKDSLAIAKKRDAIFVTNDKRLISFCHREKIISLRLNSLLRLLWIEEVLSKEQVKEIIQEIEMKDNVVIVNEEEIFA